MVNYLIGKNGSGKTSILNAVTFLNDGLNSKHFFKSDSKVELQIDQKKQWIIWDENNPNKTSHSGDLNLRIIIQKEEVSEKGANGVSSIDFSYNDIQRYQFDHINDTLNYIGLPRLTAKRIINNDDPWDTSVGKREFYHKNDVINPHFLSSGLKSINNINHFLSKCSDDFLRQSYSNNDAIIIVIEEPENNLHPDLQKMIPKMIHEWIDGQSPDLKAKLIFFISTHSPFLVSSSSTYDDQKCYLINDGLLVGDDFEIKSQSKGLNKYSCAQVVSTMLGCDVTDLGYPENYCILEEYSLQAILEDAKVKGLLKPFQFVSASGAMRIVSISDTIKELENLNTLIKCNPYYYDKYHIVIDSIEGFSSKEKARINNIRSRVGNRFHELKKESIEDYYNNLDQPIFSDYTNEIARVDGKLKGAIKAKYAGKICEKILSKDDFSTLFENELDFLLKVEYA